MGFNAAFWMSTAGYDDVDGRWKKLYWSGQTLLDTPLCYDLMDTFLGSLVEMGQLGLVLVEVI